MLSTLLALAATLTTLGSSDPLPSDYSAGWEQGYLYACSVTPAERATWAAPQTAAIGDLTTFLAGFDAAIDEAAEYEADGFDAIEWCGDVHP